MKNPFKGNPRISKRGRINEGRPTDYKPEHCETVMKLGREGKSRAVWCAEIDVSHVTLATWERAHPEFLSATTRARELSLAWWEEQGRLGIHDRAFNANAYSLQIRNRFPESWKDKAQLEHSGLNGGSIKMERILTTEELMAIASGG